MNTSWRVAVVSTDDPFRVVVTVQLIGANGKPKAGLDFELDSDRLDDGLKALPQAMREVLRDLTESTRR